MRIPDAGPARLRNLVSDGAETLQRGWRVVPGLAALVDEAARLVSLLSAVVARADATLVQAEIVIAEIDDRQRSAQRVIRSVATSAERIEALLDVWEPTLLRLQPTAAQISDAADEHVDVLIELLQERLPRFFDQFTDEVMPVLRPMDTLGQNIDDLLVASRTLNEIIGSVPGLRRAKAHAEDVSSEPD